MIRCHHFKEKAIKDPLGAIEFLQTKLHNSVNHDNPAESQEFRKLASYLFGACPDDADKNISLENRSMFSSLLSISTSSNNSVSLWNLLYTDVEEAYAGRTKVNRNLIFKNT